MIYVERPKRFSHLVMGILLNGICLKGITLVTVSIYDKDKLGNFFLNIV